MLTMDQIVQSLSVSTVLVGATAMMLAYPVSARGVTRTDTHMSVFIFALGMLFGQIALLLLAGVHG